MGSIKYDPGQNIWNKVKIKQNRPGSENFDICFSSIFSAKKNGGGRKGGGG